MNVNPYKHLILNLDNWYSATPTTPFLPCQLALDPNLAPLSHLLPLQKHPMSYNSLNSFFCETDCLKDAYVSFSVS